MNPLQYPLKLIAIGLLLVSVLTLFLPTLLAIVTVITALTILGLALNEYANWSLAHPFAYLSLSIALSIIGPLLDFLVLDSVEQNWALLGRSREILVDSGFVVLAGVGILVYGFANSWGPRISQQIFAMPAEFDRDRAVLITQIYAVIGLLAFGYILVNIPSDLSAKRSFGTAYIRWLVQFLLFAGVIGFVTILHNREPVMSKLGIASLSAVFIFFLYGFLVSSRSIIVWNVILLMAVYTQYRQLRAGPIIAAGAAFALLSSVMIAFRSNASSWTEYLLPLTVLDRIFGADRGGITALSHIVAETPHDLPYRFGETLLIWIVFPIPRAIWPGKPVNVGGQIAAEIYGAGNGTPPTLIGELYWNFGILGVLGGMFVLGIALRSLVTYRERNGSPWTMLFSTVLLLQFARITTVTPLMIEIGMWLVPLSIAVYWCSYSRGTCSLFTVWEHSSVRSSVRKLHSYWDTLAKSSYILQLFKRFNQSRNKDIEE